MVKRNRQRFLVIAASVLVMPVAQALAAPPEFVPWRADHHIRSGNRTMPIRSFGTGV